jgi:hypothetical protein
MAAVVALVAVVELIIPTVTVMVKMLAEVVVVPALMDRELMVLEL